MPRPSRLARLAELLVVAILGAGLAVGLLAALGKLGGGSTTIVRAAPRVRTVVTTTTAAPAPTAPAAQPPLAAGGLTPEQIYRQDAPAVVQVTATSATAESLGSGFVIDTVGHVVTNYHVVKGASTVEVSFSGNDELRAKIVGIDPSTDVAVLKVQTHARALTPIALGDSNDLVVGDPVYAIGNPFGFTRTLTTGVISALQRQIDAPNTLKIDHVIQTDAAINHGNSGGPLIDRNGRVIGITSQISTGNTGQQGSIGIGFAIPIDTVRDSAAQIIKTGKVEHAFLGVGTQQVTPELRQMFKLPTASGLLVEIVDPKSGAARAGLRPGKTPVIVGGVSYRIGGDIIVGVDGQPVATYDQLRDAVSRKRPGQTVRLQIFREGSRQTITVTLGQAPK